MLQQFINSYITHCFQIFYFSLDFYRKIKKKKLSKKYLHQSHFFRENQNILRKKKRSRKMKK